MAYMSFNDFTASHTRLELETVATQSPARFSPLEWAVVALARGDTLETPRRMGRAIAMMFGRRISNRLADDHLEALRRIAVIAWHAPD